MFLGRFRTQATTFASQAGNLRECLPWQRQIKDFHKPLHRLIFSKTKLTLMWFFPKKESSWANLKLSCRKASTWRTALLTLKNPTSHCCRSGDSWGNRIRTKSRHFHHGSVLLFIFGKSVEKLKDETTMSMRWRRSSLFSLKRFGKNSVFVWRFAFN